MIGYHFGEKDWGLAVEDAFHKKYGDVNNLEFYTILNSDVETGDFCEKSEFEIAKKIRDIDKIDLVTILHSDLFRVDDFLQTSGSYSGNDEELVNKLKTVERIRAKKEIYSWMSPKELNEIPIAVIESRYSLKRYSDSLIETADLIKTIDDIHCE